MNHNEANGAAEAYEKIGEFVSIFERGHRWYCNYQYQGRQVRKSLKTRSKKQAKTLAARIENQLLAGTFQPNHKPPTIDNVIAAYIAHKRSEVRADRTYAKYELVRRRVVELATEHRAKSIRDVNLSFLDEYRHRRFQEERAGKKTEARTVQNEVVIIRQFVNFALSRGMINEDPLRGLKIKKVKPKRQPFWNPQEAERILAASGGSPKDVFLLFWETGMRFAEAAWLTWSDIDFDRGVIVIQEKDGWKPKNGEARAIPMSPRVREMLQHRPRNFRWVFTMPPSTKYPDGGHQLQESRLLAYLKRRLKRTGLPTSGKLHSFRHSFVTRALLGGTPESVVRDWVGHIDHEVIKLYTHITSTASRAAMDQLNIAPVLPVAGKEEVAQT